MNKTVRNNANLNTINIFYHQQYNGDSINEAKSAGKSKEPNDSITHNTNQNMEQINEASSINDFFNDSNLKYGKSQTLKESSFKRFRLHIYRRQKKTKWLQLLQKSSKIQEQNRFGDTWLNSLQPKLQRVENVRQNKTCSKRIRVVQVLEENSKNKTKTCETNEFNNKRTTRDSPRNDGKIERELQSIQRNYNVISRMGKLHEIISQKRSERVRMEMNKEKTLMNKQKRRNVSDNLTQASRRHFKYQQGYNQSPPKLLFERRKIKETVKQADQSQLNEKEEQFRAWEMSDNFASKHGIEEYAKEQDIEVSQRVNDSPKREDKSKKYRKRITFRHANQ